MTDRSPRLAGKKALITGGAGGIGSAIAAAFLKEGADVLITDLDDDAAIATAERLSDLGRIQGIGHDVTSEADWRTAVETAESTLGGLSVLVNNAGIWVSGTVEDTDYATWKHGLSVNLDSVYLGTRIAMPLLRANQPASIINLSSIAGLIAGPNIAAYNTAKAGVWMLTKSTALAAARAGDSIRCNSVHPFFIDTGLLEDVFSKDGTRKAIGESERDRLARQTPMRRLGTTDDVAYAAIYLASDESGFMTGAELKIDGGISAM